MDNNKAIMDQVEASTKHLSPEEQAMAMKATADFLADQAKFVEMQQRKLAIAGRLNLVTTTIASIMWWLVMGAVIILAVWGISFGLKNLFQVWGLL